MINRKKIKLKRKKEQKMAIILEFKKKITPSVFYTDEEMIEIAELSKNDCDMESFDSFCKKFKE